MGSAGFATGNCPSGILTEHCGVPFLANPRTGLFQPLNALFLFLPVRDALAVHAFLCLFLMGFFAALLGRALGLGYTAALLGGVTYAFSGIAAAGMSRPAVAGAMVWTPFVFWAVSECALRRKPAWGVVAGLGGGLLLLSGAYAVVAAVGVVLACYAVITMGSEPSSVARSRPRAAWGYVLAAGIAPACAAIQLVPTAAWLLGRAEPLATLWGPGVPGESPDSLASLCSQILATSPGMLPRVAYMGIGALLLTPAALFHKTRKRQVVFFLGVALCLLVLVLRPGPLPGGFPDSHLFVPVALSVAMLTALGADRLLVARQPFRGPGVVLPGGATLLAVVILFLMSAGPVRGRVLVFAAVVLLFLMMRSGWLVPVCGLCYALAMFFDLSIASANAFAHPFQNAPACYEQAAEMVKSAQAHTLGDRVAPAPGISPPNFSQNIGMLTNTAFVGGWGIPLDEAQAKWWRAAPVEEFVSGAVFAADSVFIPAEAPLLKYMAGRVVLAPHGQVPGDGPEAGQGLRLAEIGAAGEARLFVNRDVLPRAYWVPQWRVVSSIEDILAILTNESFDPRRECVVASEPNAAMACPSEPVPGEAMCSVEEVSPERLMLRVQAPAHGIVVLSDTYAPGWRASCAEGPCALLRTNGLFRGIEVPPGQHEILFEYRPLSVLVGRVLSLALLAVGLLGGLVVLARG